MTDKPNCQHALRASSAVADKRHVFARDNDVPEKASGTSKVFRTVYITLIPRHREPDTFVTLTIITFQTRRPPVRLFDVVNHFSGNLHVITRRGGQLKSTRKSYF